MSKSVWYIILIIVIVLILIYAFRGDSTTDTGVDTTTDETEVMEDGDAMMEDKEDGDAMMEDDHDDDN